jgi:hypothetical protein
MVNSNNSLEDKLFKNLKVKKEPNTVFILSAPRTGSTYLYQLIAKTFQLPYISNATNEIYPLNPIIGLIIQSQVNVSISLSNKFGKTEGIFQPSEGSYVLSNWFGGGHPSQTVSNKILKGKDKHFRTTLAASEIIFNGAPLIIKNTWNCFRISSIRNLLPKAKFIWLKRDIRKAAVSDLEARYIIKGNPREWNSATPSNVEELKLLPPTHQVIENQFEINRSIETNLQNIPNENWISLWYEDVLENANNELKKISSFLNRSYIFNNYTDKIKKKKRVTSSENEKEINKYVNSHSKRFKKNLYLKNLSIDLLS